MSDYNHADLKAVATEFGLTLRQGGRLRLWKITGETAGWTISIEPWWTGGGIGGAKAESGVKYELGYPLFAHKVSIDESDSLGIYLPRVKTGDIIFDESVVVLTLRNHSTVRTYLSDDVRRAAILRLIGPLSSWKIRRSGIEWIKRSGDDAQRTIREDLTRLIECARILTP